MDAAKVKSAPPVQAAQAPKKTEQVRRDTNTQDQNPDVRAAKTAQEKPRPNVNGQGQVIGTRLSVTA